MVVIDTNVLACLLIQGDRTRLAQNLYEHDRDWRSEAFLLVEFCNVLATYHRAGKLNRSAAKNLLANAERTLTAMIQLPHAQVLDVAIDLGISATTRDSSPPLGR